MFLSRLPSDFLERLASIPSCSLAVVSLWKCGDSALNAKLASCVTSLHLHDVRRGALISFPLMLLQLRALRQLSLYSGRKNPQLQLHWAEQIRKLPPSIETLEIHANGAFQLLIFSGPCAELTPDELKYSLKLDFAAQFPRLHTLKLSDPTVPEEILLSQDIPRLPPTLTHFSIPEIHYIGSLASLSKSLEVLETKLHLPTSTDARNVAIKDWNENAPPNLQRISQLVQGIDYALDALDGKQKAEVEPEWIPSKVAIGRFWPQDWNHSTAERITSSLVEDLVLNDIDEESFNRAGKNWISSLPQGLQTLTFESKFDATLGTNLTRLPKSLTHLKAAADLKIDWSIIKPAIKPTALAKPIYTFWPPGLISIDFFAYKLPSSKIELLPRTLKTLKILLTKDEDEREGVDALTIKANHFPPQLTHLSLVVFHPTKAMRFLSKLPKKLLTLELADCLSGIVTDRHSIESSLPTSLTALKISYVRISNAKPTIYERPLTFPLQLVTLHVFMMSADHAFTALPRTLKSLFIDFMDTDKINGTEDIFSGLPPGLNNLHVASRHHSNEAVVFSPSCFSELHELTRLAISVRHFHSAVLRTIGQNKRLRTLEIFLITLDPEDLHYIPVTVEELNLGNCVSLSEYGPFKDCLVIDN